MCSSDLIKVMNLVSLLIATSVVEYTGNLGLRAGVAIVALAIIATAIIVSKRRSATISGGNSEAKPQADKVTA